MFMLRFGIDLPRALGRDLLFLRQLQVKIQQEFLKTAKINNNIKSEYVQKRQMSIKSKILYLITNSYKHFKFCFYLYTKIVLGAGINRN
jgi:hypothetical protein